MVRRKNKFGKKLITVICDVLVTALYCLKTARASTHPTHCFHQCAFDIPLIREKRENMPFSS